MSDHISPYVIGSLAALAQVQLDQPVFQNITFAGLTGFFVYWLTTKLSAQIDRLSEEIKQLRQELKTDHHGGSQ